MLHRSLTLLTLLALLALSLTARAQSSRHFTFHYGFTVKDVPANSQIRVWFPLAHSDHDQDVRVLSKNGDLKLRRTEEQEYGNAVLFAEDAKAPSPTTNSPSTTT
jgi:hypothetical protein